MEYRSKVYNVDRRLSIWPVLQTRPLRVSVRKRVRSTRARESDIHDTVMEATRVPSDGD